MRHLVLTAVLATTWTLAPVSATVPGPAAAKLPFEITPPIVSVFCTTVSWREAAARSTVPLPRFAEFDPMKAKSAFQVCG